MKRDRVFGLAKRMRQLGYSDELLAAIVRDEAAQDELSEDDVRYILAESQRFVRNRTLKEATVDPDPHTHLRALIITMQRKGFPPELMVSTLRAANGGDLSEAELLALLKSYDVRP